MAESTSINAMAIIFSMVALVAAALGISLAIWIRMDLKTRLDMTAEKLDGLLDLIKKVGAGEGGETQLGPAEPEPEKETKRHEGDQDGDLLWGDNANWIEQEREKAGWKSRKEKAN